MTPEEQAAANFAKYFQDNPAERARVDQIQKDARKATLDARAPDPRLPGFADWLSGNRERDMEKGKEFADQYFGEGNKDMAEIMKTRRERALGLNTAEIGAMRDRGLQGINSSFAAGLRGLKGLQGASGLRGGAALGQAMPLAAKMNMARAGMETDIALADMQRRSTELDALERTVTGERAGALGTQFGYAGLGAADRSSALQHLLGQDFVDALAGRGRSGPPIHPLNQTLNRTGNEVRDVFENPTSRMSPARYIEGLDEILPSMGVPRYEPKKLPSSPQAAEEEVRRWWGG